MLYITFSQQNPGKVVAVSTLRFEGAECRCDWKTFERAEEVAKAVNEWDSVGDTYIATDAGSGTYPRYDVVRAPKVGDEVSYSFNGDTYPDGVVVKVSASLKVVTTDTGSRYYRRRNTGSWIKDGTWSLVQGHHFEQNPHF